jgi:hypothetical protein
MRKLIAIALGCATTASVAQYTGGIGGGGFTSCSSSFTALPVELLHFTAVPEGPHVTLHWTTASELNNAGFQVERSSDGERFDAIIHVPGMGTTQQVTEYQALDRDPLPGLSYYRLRQTDLDGTVTWSDVVVVVREQDRLGAYPNPVEQVLHITGLEPGAVVEIIDPIGRMIITEQSQGAQLTLDAAHWPSGRYTARVITGIAVRSISIVRR